LGVKYIKENGLLKGMKDEKVKDFLQFQVRRKVTNLYKNFLFILEDQKDKSYNSEEDYQRNRKRILDYGNDTIREIDEILDSLDIKLK
jgi:hypothetical protein